MKALRLTKNPPSEMVAVRERWINHERMGIGERRFRIVENKIPTVFVA